jgi:hypothetical protein
VSGAGIRCASRDKLGKRQAFAEAVLALIVRRL